MKIKTLIILLLLFISIIPVVTSGQVCDESECQKYRQWSVYSYAGYAWSKKAGVVNPQPAIFANINAFDTDDSELANTAFVGVSLQRNISDWFSCGFSYETYALFNYQRFHSAANPAQEILGSRYVRQFLMNHQSAMFESYFKLPSDFHLLLGRVDIKPLIGAAVGVGVNDVFNFGTISDRLDLDGFSINYNTVGSNYIKKSLAWRIEAGLNFSLLGRNLSFGIAYRYYDGGTFQSGTRYQINSLTSSVVSLEPWSGSLKANEIKMYLQTDFN